MKISGNGVKWHRVENSNQAAIGVAAKWRSAGARQSSGSSGINGAAKS
jgi:hypothetical protein